MKTHQHRSVGVFVRIRPTTNFAQDLIECSPDGQTVNIYSTRDSRKLQDHRKGQRSSWSFQLEGVLQDVTQEEVYTRVCQHVVQGALDGYNGTVMCFGQTGAGKTYTMTGSTESYKERGIIPRALQEVFQEVEKRAEHSFSVHLSYLEIYNETLLDLLSPLHDSPQSQSSRSLVVMEEPGRGVFVRGLSLHPVHCEEEALNLLFEGEMNRIIGSHALNKNSSRSHCIFTVHIEYRMRSLSDAKYVTSKLSLVDLAGSERLEKTWSVGQTLKEATYVNKSLSFLEQAIVAMADRRRDHVPFRQTKLTHALKDSLGGNCNTVLVANIYGEAPHIEETLSTLRFASRMKRVQTEPAVNEHMDPALQIKKLQKEVQMLKEQLSIHNTLMRKQSISYEPLSEAQLAEINNQVERYIDGSLNEISIISISQVQAVFAQFKLAVQRQEQKVKDRFCQTYHLVKKEQRANTSDVKDWDTRSSTDDGDTFVQSQKQTQCQSSTRFKDKKTKDKQRRPPPKEEVFERFKVGPGSTINSILKENKTVLLQRRSLLHQLTEEVSAVKREIDAAAAATQQHRQNRETQGQYFVVEQEPDASLLLKLRDLKALYRRRHEALRSIKAEVNYCQHLVDQCRLRLHSEFESWYKTTFLLTEEEPSTFMDETTERQNSSLSSFAPVQRTLTTGSTQRRLLPVLPVN